MTSPHHLSGTWQQTPLTTLLGIDYPIVQGPFGGGLSTVELAAIVSERGGLGSYGAHDLEPDAIVEVVGAIRARTSRPFAVNVWVSTHDLPEEEMTVARFDAAAAALAPLYEQEDVPPPTRPQRFLPSFEEQVEAVLASRPPVFSFVFGVPAPDVLAACRERGIVTIGGATTPDEAVALDEAGVDAIVASGFEAGGHRISFLRSAEDSLTGTMALIPLVADEVRAPVIAAGGIADARGVVAALTLGAHGAQIGTAFLATDESAALPAHRALLRNGGARHTRLTRSYTGRLARGIPNRLLAELEALGATHEPYPYQARLLGPLRLAALRDGNADLISLWSGQSASLIHHTSAGELFDALVADTKLLLEP